MTTAIIFILILGVLIFVHELGHYLVAIRNGIKAEEFGFGFPPRIFGAVKDEKTGKYKFVLGGKHIESKNTIFSFNWIPLGGFVRIKGENGDSKSTDSFASKSAWIRVKVLAAGVTMNFILAWFLLAVVFNQGAPQAIGDDDKVKDARVQISQVVKGSPAEMAGISIGDEVEKICNIDKSNCKNISRVEELKSFIDGQKGQETIFFVNRGGENLALSGVPRINPPEGEGAIGVQLTRTAIISYPWYEALGKGLMTVFDLTWLIVTTLGGLLVKLFTGAKSSIDVAGPIGIAFMTKQVAALGWVYLLQFTAILSINLAIINAFPFPALDGGRIMFILIEKIKGSPVSQKFEQIMHTAGFSLLILLMVVVTFHDFIQFQIVDKIKNLF
jgi:regulator of sigma E protease